MYSMIIKLEYLINAFLRRNSNSIQNRTGIKVFIFVLFFGFISINSTYGQDTDGDTYADAIDLDDDNDGILDTDESCQVAEETPGEAGQIIFKGPVKLSVGGTYDTGNITINKPIAATLIKAYVLSAGRGSGSAVSDVRVNGTLVTLGNTETSSNGVLNKWGDVTSEIGTMLEALPTGASTISLSEVTPGDNEGTALFVVWESPNLVNGVISLKFSSTRTSDGAVIIVPVPAINSAQPDFVVKAGMAISFSTGTGDQISTITVNDSLLTEEAGGFDDGLLANGQLWTIGDDEDAYSIASEKYDITNFVTDGDTVINFTSTSAHTADYIGAIWVQQGPVEIPEACIVADTDQDGIPDSLDPDSDGDGTFDADEAYGIIGTAAVNGRWGSTNPAVNANGLVIAAGINVTGDEYTTSPEAAGFENTFQEGVLVSVNGLNSQSVSPGDNVTFTADATATATALANSPAITTNLLDLIYEWYVSTDDGANYTIIENGGIYSGAKTVALTLTNVPSSVSRNKYQVVVKSAANISGTQTDALLIVTVPMDRMMRHFKSFQNNEEKPFTRQE